jgi:hypothetical protein
MKAVKQDGRKLLPIDIRQGDIIYLGKPYNIRVTVVSSTEKFATVTGERGNTFNITQNVYMTFIERPFNKESPIIKTVQNPLKPTKW